MNINFLTAHPFSVEHHSGLYALNKEDVNKIILAALVGSIFFIIGGVFAFLGTSYYFRKRKIQQLQEEDDLYLQRIGEIRNQTIKLHGGIQQGGNTCFLAAAIQCFCKTYYDEISETNGIVEKRINYKIERVGDENEFVPYEETDLELEERQAKASSVFKIMQKIHNGKTVSGHEILSIKKMFNFQEQDDAVSFYNNLFNVFGISYVPPLFDPTGIISCVNGTSIVDAPYQDSGDLILNAFQPIDADTAYEIRYLVGGNLPPLHLNYVIGNRDLHSYFIPKKIKLKKENSEEEVSYELSAAIIYKPGHYYSYLLENDSGKKKWSQYNDGQVLRHISDSKVLEELKKDGVFFTYLKES